VDVVTEPIDPEDVTQLQPADLQEVGVDETPDDERPQPLEADPADVAEQRATVDLDDDDVDPDGDI
jgi:serine/threonine protein kinase HipA of HipAB toxin-antitoxin module